MPTTIILESTDNYTIEDNGIVGDGISVIRDGYGQIVEAFEHPEDALNIQAASSGVNLTINFADTLGSADFTVGNVAVPSASPSTVTVQNVTTSTGDIELISGGTINISGLSPTAVLAESGEISISADQMNIMGRVVAGRVTLQAASADRNISLGDRADYEDPVESLEIVQDELRMVAAQTLLVGSGISGNVNVYATHYGGDLHIRSGASVGITGRLSAGSLEVSSADDISINLFETSISSSTTMTFNVDQPDDDPEGGRNRATGLRPTAYADLFVVRGNEDADTLRSFTFREYLPTHFFGFGGNDDIKGWVKDDRLDGGTGADRLEGFRGNDVYFVDDPNDQVIEIQQSDGGTADHVLASISYSLTAETEVEFLSTGDETGAAAINLSGSDFGQTITGNAGNNVLDGRGGIDAFFGLAGDDWYFLDHADEDPVEMADNGTDRVLASISYELREGRHVEILSTADNAGLTNLNLTGNSYGQIIQGNAGNNILDGGAGIDSYYGLGGNDWYVVDHGQEKMVERAGDGNDRVLASVSYALREGQYVEVLTTTDNLGTINISLTGNSLSQVIQGNEGDNVLDGRGGADTFYGLGGDDWYYVDHAQDNLAEVAGGGSDRVLASVSYTLLGGRHVEVISTNANDGQAPINLTGNDLSQIIQGNAGDNVLRGEGGIDTFYGLGGDDWYYVDHIGEKLVETAAGGDDRVLSSTSFALREGQHVETLSTDNNASSARINLTGNSLDQVVQGNAGINILNGRDGNDILVGLGGDDIFVFNTALDPSGNVDTIFGFSVFDDRIALDSGIFGDLPEGRLAPDAFVAAVFASEPDDRILYNPETGALSFDADGSGATAAIHFASINGGLTNLSANDFIVI